MRRNRIIYRTLRISINLVIILRRWRHRRCRRRRTISFGFKNLNINSTCTGCYRITWSISRVVLRLYHRISLLNNLITSCSYKSRERKKLLLYNSALRYNRNSPRGNVKTAGGVIFQIQADFSVRRNFNVFIYNCHVNFCMATDFNIF